MTNISPLSSFSLRKRPNPGPDSFESLLDMLAFPALLLDTSGGRVVMANSKTAELTSLTRAELCELSISTLFPGLDKKVLKGKESIPSKGDAGESLTRSEIETAIFRRKGSPVKVLLSLTFLEKQRKWVLIEIETLCQREQRKAEQERLRQQWEGLNMLADASLQADLLNALQSALQAGARLTGVATLAVYRAKGEEFVLSRCATWGQADILPETTQATDLYALQKPHLWIAGKRALAHLHRSARAAGSSFLATAPLGQPHALIGLVAAAGDKNALPEGLQPSLQVVASTITSILQNCTLTENLKQELNGQTANLALSAALKEHSSDGIIVISPDLTILELNPTAEAILGYANREVRGQPYGNILVGTENFIPAFLTEYPDAGIHNIENVRLFRRDGRPFLAHTRTTPVFIQDRLASLVVLIEDLSKEEQFRLRSQQLEQRALLGEVTAIFAHEVRNPINNISTGLQLMSLNLSPEDSNQEIIARLQSDCDRLADLMKSVLAFARPVEYKMETVDVGSSIRRLLDRWRPNMVRTNIQHALEIEPIAPHAIGDLRALEQVWNNLISNAIQAMDPQGGILTIKIRGIKTPEGAQRLEVSISDTGTGIPEEVRERIFEPFFTTKRNGTGLGLAIIKQIVTAHKGAIQVTSIPGATVFQVQIPVAEQGTPIA
jgi:two-component system, NtrC family, sensor histidine kinase AtoS